MATYDRPNDLQFSNPNMDRPVVGASEAQTGRGMSPSLSEQTPGLDATSRARNLAMRPVSWARERPAIAFSILGGLAVIGIGTFLAMRSRRPSRLEMLRDQGILLRDKGADLYDWLRSKL
jgi:hypothetical protein